MFENTIEQPFAQDAEQVVVASCLLTDGADTFDVVSQIVSATDFYDPVCGILFTCMQELAKDNKPIDEITVFDKVKKGLRGRHRWYNRLVRCTEQGSNFPYVSQCL